MQTAFGWGLAVAFIMGAISFFLDYAGIVSSKSYCEDFAKNPVERLHMRYFTGVIALILFVYMVTVDTGTKSLESVWGVSWFSFDTAEKNAALAGMLFLFPMYYILNKILCRLARNR